MAERFWWLLTIVAVVWYSSVTIYVAIRGAFDIRRMLRALAGSQPDRDGEPSQD